MNLLIEVRDVKLNLECYFRESGLDWMAARTLADEEATVVEGAFFEARNDEIRVTLPDGRSGPAWLSECNYASSGEHRTLYLEFISNGKLS